MTKTSSETNLKNCFPLVYHMKKKNKGCVRDWPREHQLNENVEIITNINSRTNTNNRINTNTNTNNNDHEHENQSIGESNYPKLLLYCTITLKYCGQGSKPNKLLLYQIMYIQHQHEHEHKNQSIGESNYLQASAVLQ